LDWSEILVLDAVVTATHSENPGDDMIAGMAVSEFIDWGSSPNKSDFDIDVAQVH
jgi:hypothetical protein